MRGYFIGAVIMDDTTGMMASSPLLFWTFLQCPFLHAHFQAPFSPGRGMLDRVSVRKFTLRVRVRVTCFNEEGDGND